jgi:hypothetical protein
VLVEDDIMVDEAVMLVDVLLGEVTRTTAPIAATTMATATQATAMLVVVLETPLLCIFMMNRYAHLCITLFILWER